eukprot:2765241-Rhodomonas_salina.1
MAGGADVIFGCGGFTGSQAIKYASSSAARCVPRCRNHSARATRSDFANTARQARSGRTLTCCGA